MFIDLGIPAARTANRSSVALGKYIGSCMARKLLNWQTTSEFQMQRITIIRADFDPEYSRDEHF